MTAPSHALGTMEKFSAVELGALAIRWPLPELSAFIDYAILFQTWRLAVQSIPPEKLPSKGEAGSDRAGETSKPPSLDAWTWVTLLRAVMALAERRQLDHQPVFDRSGLRTLALAELDAAPAPDAPVTLRDANLERWRAMFGLQLTNPETGLLLPTRVELAPVAARLYGSSTLSKERVRARALKRAVERDVAQAIDIDSLQRLLDQQEQEMVHDDQSLESLARALRITRGSLDYWGTSHDTTLAAYLSPQRQRLIESLTDEAAAALREVLRSFAQSSSLTQEQLIALLRGMWEAVTPMSEAAALRGLLRDESGIVNLDARVLRRDVPELRTAPLLLGGVAVLRRILLTQRDLTPAQQLVYRVAWDVSTDMGERHTGLEEARPLTIKQPVAQARERSAKARSVGRARLDSFISFAWPTPAFPALLDEELWSESWNTVSLEASRDLTPEFADASSNCQVLDRLAFAYLCIVQHVVTQRTRAIISLKPRAPSREEWLGLLTQYKSMTEYRGARSEAYQRFRADLALFSTAWFGLSSEAASAFHQALAPIDLRAQVNEYLARDSSNPPTWIARLVATYSKQYPNYPSLSPAGRMTPDG
jgi:hypothetical protein